jgi:hypothetical protein
MPMKAQVNAASVLVPGITSIFADAWKTQGTDNDALLNMVMDMNVPSGGAYEIHGYFEKAPYPARKPRGREVKFGNFGSKNFTVYNYEWANGVSWDRNDRFDDRTKTLYDQAFQAGVNFGTLAERVFFQVLLSSTNLDLLPGTVTAPDGVAIFSATDGAGAARFGITNGNLLTGSGVASSQAVVNDIYRATVQMGGFLDPQGQPLWERGVLDKGLVVIYGIANDQVVREAVRQRTRIRPQMNVAAAENVGAAAVSNIWQDFSRNVELWPTARITTNDIFVFLANPHKKAVFRQVREDLRTMIATAENSDEARKRDEEYVAWEARYGFGVFLPYQCCMIDN